mmetsp:Transcript_29759/g.59296  ORF Transcript_29759/g.59296 Transcript_29759/m.59296 type:complete len:423 (-) Transcript_29759:137-1405(-)
MHHSKWTSLLFALVVILIVDNVHRATMWESEILNKATSMKYNCAPSNIVSMAATYAVNQTAKSDPMAKPKQNVVLLVGPHKTGSTSIQANLFNWLHNDSHPSKLAPSWAWPSPLEDMMDAGCKDIIDYDEMKKFALIYQWTKAMREDDDKEKRGIKCMFSPNGTQIYSVDQYLAFYEKEFHRQWVDGRGLVTASEALDMIGESKKGSRVLKRVVAQLPWHSNTVPAADGSDSDITAVVAYRSPRSKHLESLWHQCCMDKESFEHYLIHLNDRSWFPTHSLDSLNLANQFLKEGIKTLLIDLAGVLVEGYDVSNVIACDVLGAACTTEKRFMGALDEKPIIANAKNKNHTITLEQMQQIDEVIEEYECNFLTMLGHRSLTILYPSALDKLVEKCEGLGDRDLFGVEALKGKIVKIAKKSASGS